MLKCKLVGRLTKNKISISGKKAERKRKKAELSHERLL